MILPHKTNSNIKKDMFKPVKNGFNLQTNGLVIRLSLVFKNNDIFYLKFTT